MSVESTTPSRTIALSGFNTEGLAPGTAISLVDGAGNTLQKVFVKWDGSCTLAEAALASAHVVMFGPVNVGLPMDAFLNQVETTETFDVAAFLTAPLLPAKLADPAPRPGGHHPTYPTGGHP